MNVPKQAWMNLRDQFSIAEVQREAPDGLFTKYTKVSTIHGIRQVGDRKHHIYEKIWWGILLAVSLLFCSKFLLDIWNRWDEGPIIVALADKTDTIREIPFPAITICPETKAKMQRINFTKIYHVMQNAKKPPYKLTDEEVSRMEAMAQVCDSHLTAGFQLGTNLTTTEIYKKLKEISPPFNDIFFYCKWRNNPTNCHDFFSEVWTEDGLCYTFNLLNSDDIYSNEVTEELPEIKRVKGSYKKKVWSLEEGYKKHSGQDALIYPWQSYGAGGRGGINILLRSYEDDFEYICRGPVLGFKVLLHMPGDIPQISNHFIRVPFNKETLITVNPRVTKTANSLKKYDPITRGCYYTKERQLKFFNEYTLRNCELECTANFTLNYCGCVKFSMPRDNSTQICGAKNIKCLDDAATKLLEKTFSYENYQYEDPCNCLPTCTSITYEHEISQADFNWKELFLAYESPLNEFPGMTTARLSVMFKENHLVTLKRHELYSHIDLLALCGGILGLFFGASVLSFCQIFHFFTFGLFFNKARNSKSKQDILSDEEVIFNE